MSCKADTGNSQIVVPVTISFLRVNLDSDLANIDSDKFFIVRANMLDLLWIVFLQLDPSKPSIGVEVLYFTYAQ